MNNVRDKVNPLAADDHLKEVIQQLQLMGEVTIAKPSYTNKFELRTYDLYRASLFETIISEAVRPMEIIGLDECDYL